MKQYLQTILLLAFSVYASAQTGTTDFVPGANVIFEDHFENDPVGDFPAKWSTNGDGQVVTIDNADGKWLKISQPTAVSPELKKALPENCTIEFDLYLKSTTGIAPHIMFGLTPLSDVAGGDVYRRYISAKIDRYNETGVIKYAKDYQDLGEKQFAFEGYVNRVLHVSMSVNKTRWRVYFDDQKVIDMPKLLTPEYRNNFFVASSVVIPSAAEAVYLSNVRIAAGDADARSLLVKQLLEQGSVTTSDIQFNPQTNELTPESQPVVDQLGQALQQNPDMNIQINGMEETPIINTSGTGPVINKVALKQKADKIKAYLVNKFKVRMDRIVTDAKAKATEVTDNNKPVGKAKKFLAEIVKL